MRPVSVMGPLRHVRVVCGVSTKTFSSVHQVEIPSEMFTSPMHWYGVLCRPSLTEMHSSREAKLAQKSQSKTFPGTLPMTGAEPAMSLKERFLHCTYPWTQDCDTCTWKIVWSVWCYYPFQSVAEALVDYRNWPHVLWTAFCSAQYNARQSCEILTIKNYWLCKLEVIINLCASSNMQQIWPIVSLSTDSSS